jgi:hypothetical protein
MTICPFGLARLVPQPLLPPESRDPGPKGSTLSVEMQKLLQNPQLGSDWKGCLIFPKKCQLIPEISNS